MIDHFWWVFGISLTVIIGLIGVIYASLIARIERLVESTDKGLDLKVDDATYKVAHQYERELFNDMRLTIKELRDENSLEHKAIMIEIKRQRQ